MTSVDFGSRPLIADRLIAEAMAACLSDLFGALGRLVIRCSRARVRA